MNILGNGRRRFFREKPRCDAEPTSTKEKKVLRDGFDLSIYEFDLDSAPSLLDDACGKSDFVFHLAGVNRPMFKRIFSREISGYAALY
jgi:UDP-2-acetamido-2,6-beta-L-arabino-hexul-4-ose reductase